MTRKLPKNVNEVTIHPETEGGRKEWAVVGHGTYPSSSVLAGQYMFQRLGWYESVEEALKDWPMATLDDLPAVNHNPASLGPAPADWFDPAAAGERWDDDY